jgi:hypothetical protein
MITADFIVILFFAIFLGVAAIFALIYGIYTLAVDKDVFLFNGMVFSFLFLSFLSGIVSVGAYNEYQNAKPQNQVKILKQKIFDAEKVYQKYLIDHPEFEDVKE